MSPASRTDGSLRLPDALLFRARLLQEVRRFFFSRGYLEVDTPIRQPAAIPEEHIRLFGSDGWWLQASPELCMKRLLARGCEKIFQICHCFRHGESGPLHLPEFTMLEWYHVDWDYRQLMEECEGLVRQVAAAAPWPAVAGEGAQDCLLRRGGREVALGGQWPRRTVRWACRQFCGKEPEDLLHSGSFDKFLVEQIEPQLGWQQPVFLCDYPVALGALARARDDDAGVAERFELYLASVELVNGFSELNDPLEQERRFRKALQRMAPEVSRSLPRRFLDDLKAMPKAAGAALGVDRLLMLLTGASMVHSTVAFPPEEL